MYDAITQYGMYDTISQYTYAIDVRCAHIEKRRKAAENRERERANKQKTTQKRGERPIKEIVGEREKEGGSERDRASDRREDYAHVL